MSPFPRRRGRVRNTYRCCESGTVGGKSSRAARVWRRAIECEREEDKRRGGRKGKEEARMAHAERPEHIERIQRSSISQGRRPTPSTVSPPPSSRPLPSRVCPPHLSALGGVSRRGILTLLAPYLARELLSFPLSLPLFPSLFVSDRVPLFRVLYYFFYQSARFQDALRPVESCAINHEM